MKTKTINFKDVLLFIIAIAIFSSCQKTVSYLDIEDPFFTDNGYFVTNEGAFFGGNGSVTYVSEDGDVFQDIFENANGFKLGNTVQSMSIINNKAYIVENGSGSVTVARADSMTYIASITAISPRYITQVSTDKAYITDWGIDGVQVVDLNTNTVTSTISCGVDPEAIITHNGYAYVCNSANGYLSPRDSTITIIDIANDNVIATLVVGDNPNSIQVDADGDIWVLSGGYTLYESQPPYSLLIETAGKLTKISANTVVNSFDFPIGNHPKSLIVDDLTNTLYYLDGSGSKSVYAFNISDSELSTLAVINRDLRHLDFHDGFIYAAYSPDFTSNGWSYRYSTDGLVIDSVQVGLIPGGYYFN